jgi:hypothetical protein
MQSGKLLNLCYKSGEAMADSDPWTFIVRPNQNVIFKCKCGAQADFIINGASRDLDKRGKLTQYYVTAQLPPSIANAGRIVTCTDHIMADLESIFGDSEWNNRAKS